MTSEKIEIADVQEDNTLVDQARMTMALDFKDTLTYIKEVSRAYTKLDTEKIGYALEFFKDAKEKGLAPEDLVDHLLWAIQKARDKDDYRSIFKFVEFFQKLLTSKSDPAQALQGYKQTNIANFSMDPEAILLHKLKEIKVRREPNGDGET